MLQPNLRPVYRLMLPQALDSGRLFTEARRSSLLPHFSLSPLGESINVPSGVIYCESCVGVIALPVTFGGECGHRDDATTHPGLLLTFFSSCCASYRTLAVLFLSLPLQYGGCYPPPGQSGGMPTAFFRAAGPPPRADRPNHWNAERGCGTLDASAGHEINRPLTAN